MCLITSLLSLSCGCTCEEVDAVGRSVFPDCTSLVPSTLILFPPIGESRGAHSAKCVALSYVEWRFLLLLLFDHRDKGGLKCSSSIMYLI